MMSSEADSTACKTDSEVQQELQKSGMPSQVRDPRGIAWAFPTRLETTFPEFKSDVRLFLVLLLLLLLLLLLNN